LNDLKVGNISLWLDDVAELLPEFFLDNYVLIASLDYESEAVPITPFLNCDGLEYELLGKSMLIMPHSLKNMLDFRGFFTNPCERYVLPASVDYTSLPHVSEYFWIDRFDTGLPDGFMTIFKQLRATAYLGEGYGPNYVCSQKWEQKLHEIDVSPQQV